MASLVTPKQSPKHRWVQFYSPCGRRKTLRLGESNDLDGSKHVRLVEALLASIITGRSIEPRYAVMIGELKPEIRERYIRCGLISAEAGEDGPGRKATQASTLGEYLEQFVQGRKLDIKESSQVAFNHTRKRLEEYFGKSKPMRDITAVDARAFRTWLAGTNKRDKVKKGEEKKGLSHNTIRRRMGFCKQVFSEAVSDGIVDRNPFERLPASVRSNKDRQEYVSMATFSKVLRAAPNARWRSLLVLARIGALRIPSEAAKLEWAHVDFDAKRIHVVGSSKTERHAKREVRTVPMLPEIEKELLAWHMEGPSGEFVFPGLTGETNLRTTLEKIIKKAKVLQWPKLWQNLRASGSTDFARSLPGHVAAAICGHTEQIAKEHYWQVTESDLDAVIADRSKAVQPEAIPEAETGVNGMKAEEANTEIPGKLQDSQCLRKPLVDDIGLEPTTPTMSTWCSNQLS